MGVEAKIYGGVLLEVTRKHFLDRSQKQGAGVSECVFNLIAEDVFIQSELIL